MITDKDIIIELLTQRDDLKATLEAIKSGNFSSLPNSIQAALKPDNAPETMLNQRWILKDSYDKLSKENDETKECVNELNEIIAGLRKEKFDLNVIADRLNQKVQRECNFPELRKLLNIPEGQLLSVQLDKKVQEIMIELDNARHERDSLEADLDNVRIERDQYQDLAEERKVMYHDLRAKYDALSDALQAKNPLYKGKTE